jgi:hypothetical protein
VSSFTRYLDSVTGKETAVKGTAGLAYSASYVYDTPSLTWVPALASIGGGSTVTVTNFPSIQPVSQSGTWTTGRTWTLASGTDSVNVGNFPASQAVTGTFFQAIQPVSAVSLPLPTGAATEATLAGRLKPADTLAGVTTVAAVTAITNALPTGANKLGTVDIATAAATAKGTQGANGVPVQDLKDAGRSVNNLFMVLPIITTATDALQSLTGFAGTAAVTATTTPAVVTTAKTRRIDSIVITYVAIATAGSVRFTLRANPAGVVAITSAAVANWVVGGPAAVAGVAYTATINFPNGLEFAAATGIGVSMVGLSAVQALAAVGYGQIAINATEY